MNRFNVVTFGEAMVLFRAEEAGKLHQVDRFTRTLAGAETNVAIGFARLGYRTGWVSQVGNDSFGQYIISILKNENVDTTCVNESSEFSTGFQLKSKIVDGDPEVEYYRKGSAASKLNTNQFKPEYFKSAGHLHMTGIPLALSPSMRLFAEEAITTMKASGRTISFDPNLRPQLWANRQEMIDVANQFAIRTDYVLPGLKEGHILTGYTDPEDIAKFYLDKGVRLVAIKLGPNGAYYMNSTSQGYVPGFVVQVVDTVGAGDGFAVGVISGLLDGLKVEEAVIRGNAIGAMAVTTPGDMDGLPSLHKLNQFMMTAERSTNNGKCK